MAHPHPKIYRVPPPPSTTDFPPNTVTSSKQWIQLGIWSQGCTLKYTLEALWEPAFSVIHLEKGSSESRDSHSIRSKAWRLEIRHKRTGIFVAFSEKNVFKITNLFGVFAFGSCKEAALSLIQHNFSVLCGKKLRLCGCGC